MDRRHFLITLGMSALLLGQAQSAPQAAVIKDAQKMLDEYANGKALYDAGQYREAFRVFLPLAKAGFPQAKMSIAYQYEQGQGVMLNPGQAMRWYQSAADDGLPAAIIALGIAYREGLWVQRNLVLSYALFITANTIAPGKANDALSRAVAESLTTEQKRLGKKLASKMKPGHGAITRIMKQAQRIGMPIL